MRFLRFRLRTLLLFIGIMGMVFFASREWPVRDVVFDSRQQKTTLTIPAGADWQMSVIRPPTSRESSVRTAIALAILLIVFVALGAWRST